MKNKIFLLSAIIVLFLIPSSYGQGWEKSYPYFPRYVPTNPDYGNNVGYRARSIVPLDNGNFLALIANSYHNNGNWLLEIDENGKKISLHHMNSDVNEDPIKLIKTGNGNFLLASPWYDSQIKTTLINAEFQIISESIFSIGDLNHVLKDLVQAPGYGSWLVSRESNFPNQSLDMLWRLNEQGEAIGSIEAGFENFFVEYLLSAEDGGVRAFGAGFVGEGASTARHTFMRHYDKNGQLVNETSYSDSDDPYANFNVVAGAATADGGVVMTVKAGKTVVLKVDSTGTELWRKKYQQYNNLYPYKIIAHDQGYRFMFHEIHFGGKTSRGLIDIDLSGNTNWKKQYTYDQNIWFNDILLLPDNGTLIGGVGEFLNEFERMAPPRIVRTDAEGNTFNSAVKGNVSNDDNDDCLGDGFDLAEDKYVVAFQNGYPSALGKIDSIGNYVVPACPGEYKLAPLLPNSLWSICQDSLDIIITGADTLTNQDFVIAYNNEPMDSIYGYVFEDYDNDCLVDSFETTFYEGWEVALLISENDIDTIMLATTDANGYYSFNNLQGFSNGAGAHLSFEQPIGTGLNCVGSCIYESHIAGYSYWPSTILHTSFQQNNGISCDSLPLCPILDVAIATDRIRPCVEDTYYVEYCNIGGLTTPDVYVEVTIDSLLQVTSASIPWTSQVDNVFTFEIGYLQSNECGSFQIDFDTPCDAPVGLTFCSEVHAYPDSSCAPPGAQWDGSEIQVTGICLGDSIKFEIKNIGTGNMLQSSDYIIIEDNVLLYSTPQDFQLDVGELVNITLPTEGYYYRLEAQQSQGFPGLSTPTSWVEGCDANGEINIGIVNQYPLGDEDPWLDVFCLESVNSYDPNDKTGYPTGVGPTHQIGQNVPLEYMIRFQNTGTAEAFNIEIRDVIPIEFLDPFTVRPGASSHPYEWDMQGDGVVVFKFNNINLPDSTSDLEGSQGFVQFKVQQRQDLPIGTEIKNTAAIYFDNNDPIITNETLHTIGEDLFTGVNEPFASNFESLPVEINPNPFHNRFNIRLTTIPLGEKVNVEIYDTLGKKTNSTVIKNGASIQLNYELLPGIYFFKCLTTKNKMATGKFIKAAQ